MSSPPTTPPAASPFIPRKEFLQGPKHIKNSFSLLAISGPNCVRLYSFTADAVQTLRRVLEHYAPILTAREDPQNSLSEFSLDKKPWANPKSVPSEKLLVDILVAVYQCGYTYLSTVDYGREADDRLVMAFSKPEPITPPSSSNATGVSRNGSSSSTLSEKPLERLVPFAISFSSMTVMRVISPPLHLTPAILQACRGAWPRGVVSEKRVYQNSYEFKLKGYGLFQQDTFATDSLRHILTLLSSLDAQLFSLITSISLTSNHSRIKDLWIFTGPAPEDTITEQSELMIPEANALRRFSFPPGNVDASHRRLGTEATPHSPLLGQHNRSSSENSQRQASPTPHHNVLRKAAPRAQVPVDVRVSEILDSGPATRAHLPSNVPTGVADMTGIGSGRSPNVFYEASPFDVTPSQRQHDPLSPTPVLVSPILRRANSTGSPRSPGPVSGRTKTPPLFMSYPPSRVKSPPSPVNSRPATPVAELRSGPHLISSSVFRDSSDTDMTREIPIKWTGPLNSDPVAGRLQTLERKTNQFEGSPVIPGGWQTTPIPEKEEGNDQRYSSEEKERCTPPIQENESRIQAPEIVEQDAELRKSEAVLVGIIKSTSPLQNKSPPMSPSQTPSLTQRKDSAAGGGQGWVMVNVENSNSALQTSGDNRSASRLTPPVSDLQSSESVGTADAGQQPLPQQASPEAKAIVVIDVLNSKKPRSTSSKEGDSGIKRLFSLSRKNSKVLKGDDDKEKHSEVASTSIPRSNLRDKLRLIGTPEAARREDKRRSID